MTKNKGYSLVEMLIVIAIIAILGTLSIFSIGIMRDARRQTAVNNFNNLISGCLVKTKAVADTGKPVAMVIQKRSDGKITVRTGYYDGTNVTKIGKSASPVVLSPEVETDCDATFPKDIAAIRYIAGADDSVYTEISATDIAVIKFRKSDGKVLSGAGKYQFIKGTGDSSTVYATVVLDETTGNHFMR